MKNKSWLNRVFLLLIVLLALFLYFYKLNQLPNSLSDDEATVGYNAYSILSTGKDEFGKSFPIAFRFFGAYTPPIYVYLVIPVIKFFGLSPASVRVPSGLLTILGVFIIYFFIKKLNLFKSSLISVVGAFIFATSPLVIYYARIGYEVTAGYIIFALGTLFLWIGISKNKLSLWGLILLSISTYVAHTERYLVPIFLLFIFIFFHKKIVVRKNKTSLIWGLIILLVSQIPNIFLLTTKSFWVKNSVFSNLSLRMFIGDFISQFLTYFSPKAIFGISPDINLQHSLPEIGLFYSWLVIPFLIGLYQLYLKLRTPAGKYLVILFLTAPLPGALSGHFISIQRVLTLVIPLVLIICLGIDFILQKIRPVIFLPLFLLLSAFSLLLFWRSYFVLFPKERFPYWSYGYQQLAEIVKNNPNDHFVIDSARAATVYVDFLFYLKYSPTEYQKRFSSEFVKNYYNNPSDNGNYRFANIELRSVVWKDDIFENQVLVGDALAISSDQEKEHFLEKVFEINDPNGKAILFGYKTNPDKKKAENWAKEYGKIRGLVPK